MRHFRRWLYRHPHLLHPRIYALGKSEAHSGFGMTYGDPYTLRSVAYDLGRNKAEFGKRWP